MPTRSLSRGPPPAALRDCLRFYKNRIWVEFQSWALKAAALKSYKSAILTKCSVIDSSLEKKEEEVSLLEGP